MAVLTEGCSEFIRKNYLPDFLQYVLSAVLHDNPIVCNAALYAAGKFAEFLQPDISRFSDQLMPVLYHYLDRVYECGNEEKDLPRGVIQMFYALETFCENLDDALLPELPELMRRLIDYLNKGTSLQIRGLVFSAIGAAANATKQNMLPYFPDIMRHLDAHLAEPPTEETMSLQIQAIGKLFFLIKKSFEIRQFYTTFILIVSCEIQKSYNSREKIGDFLVVSVQNFFSTGSLCRKYRKK